MLGAYLEANLGEQRAAAGAQVGDPLRIFQGLPVRGRVLDAIRLVPELGDGAVLQAIRMQLDRHGRRDQDGDGRECDAGGHVCNIRSVTRAVPRSRVPILLLLAGVLIWGFTILRGVEPFDEGLTLQAARRVADGQLPYSQFLWPYGPAHPYLLAGLFKLFGTSLLWWRVLRVLVDAGVALLVFEIVRREAPFRVALVSWLITACAMAQPTGANPFAPALLFTLGAMLLAARAGSRRDLILAGLLCALAAAWRLDFGVFALIAAAAAACAGASVWRPYVLGKS